MTQGQPAALGHGMGTAPEQKDWPDIRPKELMVLQQYYVQLQGCIEILWHSPRPFSSALLVRVSAPESQQKHEMMHVQDASSIQSSLLNLDTEQMQQQSHEYFIKRSHHSFRSVEDLVEEHHFIQFLAQQGVAVPEVLLTQHQQSAVLIDQWVYEVHKKANGLDLYVDHLSWKPFFYPEHAAQAGYTLAKIHQVSARYPVQTERSARYLVSNQRLLQSDHLSEAIQQRIQQSPALLQFFSEHPLNPIFLKELDQTHQNIKKHFQAEPKIWTHNDLHASNLLWSDATAQAQIRTVIDFGLCDYTCAIYDLAVTIERNFIDWLALEHSQQISVDESGLSAFLKAYFSISKAIHHPAILAELLKIVHIDFALSELEYFLAITRNIQHAHAAYEDWLIGHFNWFQGQQGQQLSEMIQRIMEQVSTQQDYCLAGAGE